MFVVCGVVQLSFLVAYSCVLACVVSYDFEWIYSGGGLFDRLARLVLAGGGLASVYGWIVGAAGVLGVYVRSVVAVVASFAVVCSLPVVVKWVLVGRWKATEFPVWGWAYIRFWVVKTLVRMNPVVLFAGSPLFNLYLRALGAKIGRGVLVLTPTVPVCTDLLSIGAGSVVRKDVAFSCYRAHAGMIQTGPVSLGENVFVSESTVLDIDTSMGAGSQLGHASSLHRGQSVPAGQSWHGTPAQPCDTDFRAIHTPTGSDDTDIATESTPASNGSNGCHSPAQLGSHLGPPAGMDSPASDWSDLGCPVCPPPVSIAPEPAAVSPGISTSGPGATSDSRAAGVGSPGSARPGWGVAARRWVFSVGQLVSVLGVRLPVASGGLLMVVTVVPWLAAATRFEEAVFTSWGAVGRVAVVTAVAFVVSICGGLLLVALCSRVLRLVVSPGRVYRLYGTRYWAHRAITRLTNRKSMTRLFGDSSYIVGYLRYLGYDVDRVEQTGSNFGTEVKHETPFLSSVGAGTMVADGLSLMNTDYTTTTFRVSPTVIGAHNFLGNRIAYPAGGRTGDNCLLATKVMVPVDGPIRENVGLLGSPAFEIPRTVERDHRFDITDPEELHARLRAKNRHNLTTMFLHLVASWGQLLGLALISLATVSLYTRLGIFGVAAGMLTSFAFRIGYFICIDRCVRGLQALRPRGCSIYDRAFWRHERFWKLADSDYIQLFNGTPYKNLLWRLLGVKIGRRVFDDGAFLPERSFATIGDHVTLNAGCVIQCHSQEDGAFKSDRTIIGAHSTLGVGSFVHYGVVLAENVTLDADAFLMKGEQLDAGTQWTGNPARPIHTPTPPATDDEYITALLTRITALETTIDQLTPVRTGHPATKPLAAALAVLTITAGAAATAHTTLTTALTTAIPAAWHTLLTGLTPTTPPTSMASSDTDDAPGTPAPAPPTAVAPVQHHSPRRAPVATRPPVIRPRPVPVRPAPVAVAPLPAPPSQAQAEAALKQAQAEVKAAKAAQKKSKPSKDSKNSKDSGK
jgi:acetyltransferase-like isoleucine patch superfamily enzyme